MITEQQSSIHIRSYFARSVPDAIEIAHRELGPDALLLSSRPAPPEARHLGPVEVVFGGEFRGASAGPALPPAHKAAEGSSELHELSQKVDQLRRLVLAAAPAQIPAGDLDSAGCVAALVAAGIGPQLAAELVEAATQRVRRSPVREISRPSRHQPADPVRCLEELSREMTDRVLIASGINRITAVVGPPGAGKTTTLVKLAVVEGLKKGRPVRLISADPHRIGAAEQLRSYAGILGVPFQTVDGPATLARAVDSCPSDALVLIDTAGYSPALLSSMAGDIAGFLCSRQDIDTQLVLTAHSSAPSLRGARERFECFGPSGLIFTHLDETPGPGAAFGCAAEAARPVSWLCAGQLIPEDIEAAAVGRLVQPLAHGLQTWLESAA